MGQAAETFDVSTNLGKTYAPGNIKKWQGYNKNGVVKYYLNNIQVDENTYIETFFNDNNTKDRNYPRTMPNGKVKGGNKYTFEHMAGRYVEITIPYQATQSDAESTKI